MRSTGSSRAPSSALVDARILIDCGPTAPHAIARAGASLVDVEHVLITHGHPDHLHPAFLLSRQWVDTKTTLHVWGPPMAIALCRDWIGPDAAIELHVIEPGSLWTMPTTAGNYHVSASPAAHGHGNGDALADEAVLFSVTAPDDSRLLYATDTGPLDSHHASCIEGTFDAVLVDETFGTTTDHETGHLDLATLPGFLDVLTAQGAITASTRVIATHMSHHNPEPGDLRRELASLGVELLEDLAVIDTSSNATALRVLVTGGARSGKSTYAEKWAADFNEVTYVATSDSAITDPEWQLRVQAHRERRPSHWTTYETLDIGRVFEEATTGSVVIVDCLSLWLTRTLDELDAWNESSFNEWDPRLIEKFEELGRSLEVSPASVILVTNEVGMGVVPATASGRLFRDCLGRLNAQLASRCDHVVLMVSGRPTVLPKPNGQRT